MDRRARGSRGRRARGRRIWSREPTRHLTEAATPPQHPVERFTVWHSNASIDGSGGYDYEFVSDPPDELNCSICLLVLRDPSLTSCCGNHFCQSCISRIKNEGMPCPLCKEQDYSIMLNKSIIRKVKELKIKCPNSGRGCEWVGELRSIERHLDVSCGFVEVTCDYCQSEDILRNSLSDHKSICPARPYRCEYCGFKDKWVFITSIHHSKCEKYPVECPNKCGMGKIQRLKLIEHVRGECALEEIGCKFEYAGCQIRQPRKYMALHLSKNVSSHLAMVVSHLQKKLVEKDEMIDELRICNEAQSRQLSALKASVQSQEREISGLKKEVQSQRKQMEELEANTESHSRALEVKVDEMIDRLKICNETQGRQLKASVWSQEREISGLKKEVQSQRKQMEELKANVESQSRALEKVEVEVDDIQSIFYEQIFQLLKDIALRNRELEMSKRNDGGATIGGTAGSAMGQVGAIFGTVLGKSLGALVGFASTETESVASVLSKMGENEKQCVIITAIKIARERNLVEELLTKSILNNPAKARSFLMVVLKTLNFEVHVQQYRRH